MDNTTPVRVYPYENLGQASHGWLDARHHFSFGQYYNRNRMNFGTLRVINDDKIDAQKGFAPHPHRDMEIITYVREGAITHRDSMGNEGRTGAGDVQVMSAGSGVTHSEYNLEDVATRLYQIWILPNKESVTPRWEAKQFPKEFSRELSLLVSGRQEDSGKSALFIHQDAAIYGGLLKQGTTIKQKLKYQAYILASKGEIEINGAYLKQGDGAELANTNQIEITAVTDAEILVIDVPG